MLATPMMALKKAAEAAKKQDFIPIIISDSLEGESKIEGKKLDELAMKIKKEKLSKWSSLYE